MRKICIALLVLLAAALFCGPATAGTFTDDFSRTVTLPADIDKVIPSGDLALSVLISFDADFLASCGDTLPHNAEKYLPKLYANHLPQTGNTFSSAVSINYEEIMNLIDDGADVYIDVGQEKAGISEELDKLTAVTGLTSIFISQNSLENLAPSYQKIGTILGEEKRGKDLAGYIQGWIDTIQSGMKTVDKKTVSQIPMICGNDIYLLGGFNEEKSLTYQGMVVNTLGRNIVTAQGNKGIGDAYGMEGVMKILYDNDPDFIFVDGSTNHERYLSVVNNMAFADLTAVKSGNVYEIPAFCPYVWTASPFSGWGICGFIWMANLMYSDVFDYDVKEKVQEFYKTMINYDLSDEEFAELTVYSLPNKKAAATISPLPAAGIITGLAAAAVSVLRKF